MSNLIDFYGFSLNTTNISAVDDIISKMKTAVYEKAQKLYKELLEREITILVDEIVLGMHDDIKIKSVYEAAIELLNKKIAVTIAKGYDTEYNFSMAFNIFTYKKNVYIQVATYNKPLFQAVLDTPGVVVSDLSVDDMTESKTREYRLDLWNNIIDKYKDHSCMIVKVFPLNSAFAKPNIKDMKFAAPIERAEQIARYKISNHYLKLYAGGGDIPPYKLMEYMDQAFLKLTTSEAKVLIDNAKTDLLRILPVIEEKLVMTDFTETAPASKQIDNILSEPNEELPDEEMETETNDVEEEKEELLEEPNAE